MKLDGLNMLNTVKPGGAQQRSQKLSSASTGDSVQDTFKDVLGAKTEKAETRKEISKDNNKENQNDNKARVPVQQQAKTPGKLQAERRLSSPKTKFSQTKGTKDDFEKLEVNQDDLYMSEDLEEVDAETPDVQAYAEADALPSAPDAGPGFRQGPDLAMSKAFPMRSPVNPMAEKTTEVSNDLGPDSLTRRVVWNDFLRRMNDELGVPTEKILEAFSTLTEQELASAPEQNVDKLVMALGLNQDQNKLAHKLFTDLIRKTQSKSLGEELATSSTQINLSLMSQREMQRRHLQTALDTMNTQFFMSRQGALRQQALAPQDNTQNPELAAMPVTAPAVPAPELGETTDTSFAADLSLATSAPLAAATATTESVATASTSVASAAPMKTTMPVQASNKLNKLVEQMEPASEEDSSEFAQALQSNKDQALRAPQAQAVHATAAPALAATAAPAAPAATAANDGAALAAKAFAQALGITAATGEKSSTEGEEPSQEGKGETSLSSQLLPADRNLNNQKLDGAFKMNPAVPAQGPVPQMSVPDMIQQARLMVRDGGGEMKVSLTPEGLGEVAMKVSVENGRVNVEMITESDTAKKMIEKGLVDLKSNLHANNLSVESIKVDTASGLGKQLEQQYQDAQRHQAQQFLENFRQEQQGWRREQFATPSAQFARSQTQSGSANGTPSYNASNKRASSRRLDLVA